MTSITATDRDGTVHTLEGRESLTLMEILREAGLSIEALCGGSCQCATCHVFVDESFLGKLKPQTDFEAAVIEGEGSMVQSNSRLACQIKWQDDLDGIVLTVAPEA